MRSVPLLLLIVLPLILVCGCSESPPAQPAVSPATPAATPPIIMSTQPPATVTVTPSRTPSVSDNTIIIFKNTFSPANMTVRNGSTVRWVNNDDHPHNIEFKNKAFSTSTYLLGAGQSFSQRFDRTGNYDYDCLIHPAMQGTITVVV